MGRFLVIFVFLVFTLFLWNTAGAKDKASIYQKTYDTYKVEHIHTITAANGEVFKLERAWISPEKRFDGRFERIQISNGLGLVVAFTPTRVQAIPVCSDFDHCWVFMWKTVYPLPAVFKFNPDRESWVYQKNPPMKYSRYGYTGEGFIEVIDPVFGLYGVVLYFIRNVKFFIVLSVFSCLLTLQIMKFYDLEGRKKDIIRLFLSFLHFFIPPWFPLEPYIISAVIVLFVIGLGTIHYGIANTFSFLVLTGVSLLTAIWVARRRRKVS